MAAATSTTQGMKGMRYAVAAMALHVCGAFQQPRAARQAENGPGVALATDEDSGGWYYTEARNVTRPWSPATAAPPRPSQPIPTAPATSRAPPLSAPPGKPSSANGPHARPRHRRRDRHRARVYSRKTRDFLRSSAKSEAKSRPPRPWPSSSLLCFLVSSLSASSSTGAVRGRAASSSSSTCRP